MQSSLPWAAKRQPGEAPCVAAVAIRSLPRVLAFAVEYCEALELQCVALCGQDALRSIKTIARMRVLTVDFSAHRGRWEIPKLPPGEGDLHYCDSLLAGLEPAQDFRVACLGVVSRGRRRVGPSECGAVDWHARNLERLKSSQPLSWQQQLFAATHPSIARAMPRTWWPRTLKALCVLVQGSSLPKDHLATLAGSLGSGVTGAMVKRALRETSTWNYTRGFRELKAPFRHFC